MKRKFILLPITLIALSPAISLVGCGDPDVPPTPKEYIDVEIHKNPYRSDVMLFERNKNYKIYFTDCPATPPKYLEMTFHNEDHTFTNLDVDIEKVVKNGIVLIKGDDYWIDTTDVWSLCFYLNVNDDVEVYLKSHETKDNLYVLLGT